jgi:hypothetical protein
MITFTIKRRDKEGKKLSAKLERLPNCFGSGLTWYIVWEDGKRQNTLHSASGRDMYRKRELKLEIQ